MKPRTQTILSFLIIGISVIGRIFIPHTVFADDSGDSDSDSEAFDRFQSYENILPTHEYLDLSASINGTSLQDQSTMSLSATGNNLVTWSYSPNVDHTYTGSLSDILDPAVLTFDVYKGEIGSSTLIFSQTLASSTDTTEMQLPPLSAGQYIFTYSATFPQGTYPLHRSPTDLCNATGGDRCVVPEYSLNDFRTFMTQGLFLAAGSTSFGSFIPAAFGMLQITLKEPSAPQQISNVLFLPGTMESRLYMKSSSGEKRIWEPSNETDAEILAMNPDGTSKNSIYTRDIMDYLYSDNSLLAQTVKLAAGNNSILYAPFENFMDGLVKNGTMHTWQAYPYDWRYDVRDIVQNGTLIGTATSSPTRLYLQDVVQNLASSSPTGTVTIIAHSNGGLLAKALMVELKAEGKEQLVDHLIMVGTPQLGTPGAIGSLLHGDGQTRALGFVSYAGTVRSAGLTMPGPYDLLPSRLYFSKTLAPVVTFANDVLEKKYRAAYGNGIDSFEKLLSFLTDAPKLRSQPLLVDLRTPAIAPSSLVSKAKATHDILDAWTPPPTLSVTAFAGWGENTIDQYNYSNNFFTVTCALSNLLAPTCSRVPLFTHVATTTDDGDDTVVSPSAVGTTERTLYLDTQAYSHATTEKIIHQNLLSSAPIQNQIIDILENKNVLEPYLSTTKPSDVRTPLTVVSVHSPVNLMATDASGNQTGISPVPDLPGMYFIKEEIPGSFVHVLDDEKYLYLPTTTTDYHLALQGYASGETTLQIGAIDALGNSSSTQTFSEIPTTESTTATFAVTNGASSPPQVDVDGDGTIDFAATTTGSNVQLATSTIRSLLRKRFVFFETHPLQKLRFLLRLLGLRNPASHRTPQDLYSYFMKLLDSRPISSTSQDESSILMQLLSNSEP